MHVLRVMFANAPGGAKRPGLARSPSSVELQLQDVLGVDLVRRHHELAGSTLSSHENGVLPGSRGLHQRIRVRLVRDKVHVSAEHPTKQHPLVLVVVLRGVAQGPVEFLRKVHALPIALPAGSVEHVTLHPLRCCLLEGGAMPQNQFVERQVEVLERENLRAPEVVQALSDSQALVLLAVELCRALASASGSSWCLEPASELLLVGHVPLPNVGVLDARGGNQSELLRQALGHELLQEGSWSRIDQVAVCEGVAERIPKAVLPIQGEFCVEGQSLAHLLGVLALVQPSVQHHILWIDLLCTVDNELTEGVCRLVAQRAVKSRRTGDSAASKLIARSCLVHLAHADPAEQQGVDVLVMATVFTLAALVSLRDALGAAGPPAERCAATA
mmetsp:Transcript_32321/g.74990  ORF Transcript_32321/g.74990 Transcript_32321/m.74990 type:complete len:387 (-) Transcript_32321:710-1870(-)